MAVDLAGISRADVHHLAGAEAPFALATTNALAENGSGSSTPNPIDPCAANEPSPQPVFGGR